MVVPSERNLLRQAVIERARRYKALFAWSIVPRRWFYRWLFRDSEGDLRRPGEAVLADLRDFTQSNQVEIFHSDAQVLAYRLGKQAVFRRITYYLNLDEAQVQQLMELDDGY